ncbi:hypothetical protein OIU84_016468 [Salix udensis]|uniref:Uncharacterized protein n=1 Tax=Salix udensis TaxID=889485 RepID=A0AAD6J9H9_9ROSI|nr:hypothetical protein OIU84_016468 [Salix udensis]
MNWTLWSSSWGYQKTLPSSISSSDSSSSRARQSGKKWHQGGESQETKEGATISGLISASACLNAESPRTALSSVRITSSAYTTLKRSLSIIYPFNPYIFVLYVNCINLRPAIC